MSKAKVYPAWVHHKSGESKIIQSADQEHKDWKDSPAHFESKEIVDESSSDLSDEEKLKADLEAKEAAELKAKEKADKKIADAKAKADAKAAKKALKQ